MLNNAWNLLSYKSAMSLAIQSAQKLEMGEQDRATLLVLLHRAEQRVQYVTEQVRSLFNEYGILEGYEQAIDFFSHPEDYVETIHRIKGLDEACKVQDALSQIDEAVTL